MLKKTSFVRSITCATLLAAAGSASAGDMYYGGNLTFMDYSELGADASVFALSGRIGSQWNENFSGELRAGFGLGDDTVTLFGESVDFKLNHYIGAYVRGGAQVGESFYPYVVIGLTRGEAEASVSGFSASTSESDFSFGLGADFDLSESLSFNIEYMNYLDKDGGELSGFSLGLSTTF